MKCPVLFSGKYQVVTEMGRSLFLKAGTSFTRVQTVKVRFTRVQAVKGKVHQNPESHNVFHQRSGQSFNVHQGPDIQDKVHQGTVEVVFTRAKQVAMYFTRGHSK